MITATDRQAIRQGVRHMLARRESAFERFVEILKECGAGDQARAVAAFYVAEKAARWNGMDYRVTHGLFLERDVIGRAIAHIEKARTP